MAYNYSEKTEIYPPLPTAHPNIHDQNIHDPDIRDPNDINKHLRLDFLNVIAEPDKSSYSCDALHSASGAVYHYSKLFIYRFLTIFVGLPLMLFWGLTFGVYSFMMIWLAVPARRLAQSAIAESGIYVQTISDACVAPLFRSIGLVWSSVRLSLFNQSITSTQQYPV